MSYAFIRYSAEFREKVIDLQRHLWGSDPATNAAYLGWKYEQNPYLPEPIISLALHNGNAIGMRGAWGSCWRPGAGQDPVIIPCAGDTVVAPMHRRRGLLRGLNRALLEALEQMGFPFLFSVSASSPVRHALIKDGWQPVVCYDEVVYTRPLLKRFRATRLVETSRKTSPGGLRQAHERSSSQARVVRLGLPDGIDMTATPRTGEMAQLVARIEPPDGISQVRNEEYFSWRYACPLSRYRFLYSGSRILDGFMVLQTRSTNPQGTNIVDWEVENASVFGRLIRAAVHATGTPDLHIWSASLANPVRSVLGQCGFKASRYRPGEGCQPGLIMKATGTSGTSPVTWLPPAPDVGAKTWNLRMIFSDDY